MIDHLHTFYTLSKESLLLSLGGTSSPDKLVFVCFVDILFLHSKNEYKSSRLSSPVLKIGGM